MTFPVDIPDPQTGRRAQISVFCFHFYFIAFLWLVDQILSLRIPIYPASAFNDTISLTPRKVQSIDFTQMSSNRSMTS